MSMAVPLQDALSKQCDALLLLLLGTSVKFFIALGGSGFALAIGNFCGDSCLHISLKHVICRCTVKTGVLFFSFTDSSAQNWGSNSTFM